MYPPLFGRSDANPYRDILDAWWGLRDDDLAFAAMARNFAFDHRVSEGRAEKFDRHGNRPRTSDALRAAIDQYFERCVRTRGIPDFLLRRFNRDNIVIGAGEKLPAFSKDLKLVRVFDLTGLQPLFLWANQPRNRKKRWRALLTSLLDKRSGDWDSRVSDQLTGQTPGQIQEFIEIVLDVLNTSRRDVPHQPTWATTWSDLEPHVRHGPDRWLQVLGMAKPPSRWLVLLSYTVREAGTLVRPTQLDAGWQEYHFPSPPDAPLEVGGHPMDIRVLPRTRPLLQEFIHKQIDHPLHHWTDTGGELGRTTVLNTKGLDRQRIAHYELLKRVYGLSVARWMDSPI